MKPPHLIAPDRETPIGLGLHWGLSERTLRCLRERRIDSFDLLAAYNPKSLATLRGVGPTTVAELQKALRRFRRLRTQMIPQFL